MLLMSLQLTTVPALFEGENTLGLWTRCGPVLPDLEHLLSSFEVTLRRWQRLSREERRTAASMPAGSGFLPEVGGSVGRVCPLHPSTLSL